MPITVMVNKEDYEKNPQDVELIHNYPGAEADLIIHSWECPNRKDKAFDKKIGDGCLPFCRVKGPLYMRTSLKGLVILTGEHNYYDDSDFFVIYWDEATQTPKEAGYASTRGWTYPNHAEVDATPEILEKYHDYHDRLAEQKREAYRKAKEAEPSVGKRVKITRGKYHDNEGEVVWFGPDKYRRSGMVVGVRFQNGEKGFTPAKNVIIVTEK